MRCDLFLVEFFSVLFDTRIDFPSGPEFYATDNTMMLLWKSPTLRAFTAWKLLVVMYFQYFLIHLSTHSRGKAMGYT